MKTTILFVYLLPSILCGHFDPPSVQKIAIHRTAQNLYIAHNSTGYLDLIRRSTMFIDQSMLINWIVGRKTYPNFVIILGPDNWGKTTNLDMIKHFFETHYNDTGKVIPRERYDSFRLFGNGEIIMPNNYIIELYDRLAVAERFDGMFDQGIRPVIHLSFKDLVGTNATEIKEKLFEKIRSTIRPYKFLTYPDNTTELRSFLKILAESFCDLDELEPVYNVLILIDDYDAPLLNFMFNDIYPIDDMNEIIRFLKDLLHFITGDLANLESAIYRIIVTARYNIECHKYDDEFHITNKRSPYEEYFGFERENILQMIKETFKEYSPYLIRQMHKWYGGYTSTHSNKTFYNPKAIATLLNTKQIKLYSKTLQDIEFLQTVLKNHPDLSIRLLRILSNQTVKIRSSFVHKFDYRPQFRRVICDEQKIICNTKFDARLLFSMFTEDGILIEIPNMRRSRIVNNEMAYLLANHLVKHYKRRYHLKDKPFNEAANATRYFFDTLISSTLSIQNSLTSLYRPFLNRTVGQHDFHAILYAVILQAQCSAMYEFDAYYNNTVPADVVVYNDEKHIGVVIQFRKHSTAEVAFDEAKKQADLLKNFTGMKVAKYLGINLSADYSVQAVGGVDILAG